MRNQADEAAKTKALSALKESIMLLSLGVNAIEEGQKTWWNEKAKKDQRRKLYEEGDTVKLGRLNAVNNKCGEMVNDIKLGLGRFLKWNLGFEGGLEELEKDMEE